MSPVTQVKKQEQLNKLVSTHHSCWPRDLTCVQVSRDRLTIVLYYTQWCGFCRIFDPVYERVAARREFGDVMFCSIDCTAESKELDYLQSRAKVEGVRTDNLGSYMRLNHIGLSSPISLCFAVGSFSRRDRDITSLDRTRYSVLYAVPVLSRETDNG